MMMMQSEIDFLPLRVNTFMNIWAMTLMITLLVAVEIAERVETIETKTGEKRRQPQHHLCGGGKSDAFCQVASRSERPNPRRCGAHWWVLTFQYFFPWTISDVHINVTISNTSGKNVLMLTNIRKTSTYTCVAASKLGIISTDTTVKVQCKRMMMMMMIFQRFCRWSCSENIWSE